MAIELEVVGEERRSGLRLRADFEISDAFEDRFWWLDTAHTPAAWCRFTDGKVEVARAKVLFGSRFGAPYPTWVVPPTGATQIELLAVRDSLRGCGIGSAAVDLLATAFPSPLIAMSRDDRSDRFWSRLGWTEHLHEEHHESPIGCYRLFTSF